MVCVIWLYALIICISHFKKEKDKLFSEKDRELKDMPWRVFEKEIADCFSQRGRKRRLGPGNADGGKDIIVWKNGDVYLIQCKHWFGDWIVHAQQIREFYGAIKVYNTKNHEKARGIFITTGSTTEKAREEADSLGIYLRDRLNWKWQVNHFEG